MHMECCIYMYNYPAHLYMYVCADLVETFFLQQLLLYVNV